MNEEIVNEILSEKNIRKAAEESVVLMEIEKILFEFGLKVQTNKDANMPEYANKIFELVKRSKKLDKKK